MKFRTYLLIATAGLFASCGGNNKPVDLAASSSQQENKYEFGTVAEKALSSAARLPAQLLPFNQVNIFPKVNGFVKQIFVDRGSEVKKGQPLVILEAPEMEADLEAANSRFVQAQENAQASKEKYERLKEAAKVAGSVSVLDLDNASDKMKADQAMQQAEYSNLQAVKTMFGYLNIYAPFDGTIVQRNISPGALVAPGKTTDQPMLILQDNYKMRLTVYIPEDYVDKVDLKKPVSIVFDALPGQTFKAKISRSADALGTLRQEAVEIDIYNKNGMLKPGMYAEVKIPMLSGAKSLLVPNSAIVRSTEREYVVASEDGKADLVDIKEGLISKDSTEVFGDLKPKEKIVLHASDEIKQGDELQ